MSGVEECVTRSNRVESVQRGENMKYNSKGMTCAEFVDLMRERGIKYDIDSGRFIQKNGKIKGKQNKNGYRTIALNKNHIEYTFCEHRCVWVWFNGSIPDGMEINHIDANRSNNKIENLELVNHSKNMQHAVKIGNFHVPNGEHSGKSIYSNKEVLAMRALFKAGWKIYEIQKVFDAKWHITISRLIKGKRYKSVNGEIPFEEAIKIVNTRRRIG